MTTKNIGFITTNDLSRYFPSKSDPLFTHDDYLAKQYLEEKGEYKVYPIPHGTPLQSILDQNIKVLIVRSPWDYMDSKGDESKFMSWLKEVSSHPQIVLANSYELISWNINKLYLQDLAALQVPIVPTLFFKQEKNLDSRHRQHTHQILLSALQKWNQIVLKPAVSAAARDTYLIRSPSELDDLLHSFFSKMEGREFMVQPFIDEVQEKGEWSLVYLDGKYSHSLKKVPKKGSFYVQDEKGGTVHFDELPPESVIDCANKCVEALELIRSKLERNRVEGISRKLLYGRIDILVSKKYGLLVSECELIEPELFFRSCLHQHQHEKSEGGKESNSLTLFKQGVDTLFQ